MIDVIVTVAALVLVAVPAVFVPTMLQIRGRAPWALAALIVGAADVVGCTIALSPPHWLTRAGMFGAMTVVAAATVVVWQIRGRPLPPRLRRPTAPLGPLGGATWVLVVVAGAAMLVQLYVSMRVAPTNWDSMTYHLSRAAYWLQEHSASHYRGGSIRQLGSGPNAEIMVAWSMLITGTDRWVELVQWISLAGLSVTIFSGARLLRFSVGEAAFAGALFVVLPQPILQAASTQNDLVASFFVGATALFAARGIRDRRLGDLAVAAAALGLAIGTKGTALIALPALAIISVAALIAWRPPIRVVAWGAGLAVAGVLVFGSYNYVLNYRSSHDVFGGVSDQVSSSGGDRWQNMAHDLWTFADTPGLNAEWLQPLVQPPVKAVFGSAFGTGFPYAIDVGIGEDTSAYGLVGFLLLIPLLLVALLGPRSPPGRRVAAAAALTYILLFSYRIDENVWLGRVYMPGVAIAAVLFAGFARRTWSAGMVAVLALLTLIPAVLQNPEKQLLVSEGQSNVFALDRLRQIGQVRPGTWEIVTQVFRLVKPDGRIGFVGGEDSWDYPYFGAHRNHYVKRFSSVNQISPEVIARNRLDGVLFANVGLPPAPFNYSTLGRDYYWVASQGAG